MSLPALISAMERGTAELQVQAAEQRDHVLASWCAHLLVDIVGLKLMAQTRTGDGGWMT